jgi:hypothetical protein
VANFDGGLRLVNVANPAAAAGAGSLMEWFEGSKVATKEGLAVVTGAQYSNGGADLTNGLRVLNTQNPTTPYVVGTLDNPGMGFLGVVVSGDYAYVACGGSGLSIVDLRVPSRPVIAGSADTPGWASALAVAGRYAYVADGSKGLRIFDLANPMAPVSVGWIDTPGNARDVAVANNVAFVADGSSVQVIDVRNPSAPFIIGAYAPAGFTALEVEVQGTLAFVAASSGGLVILDVTNPANPSRVSSVAPSGGPNASTVGLALSGNLVCLANSDGGLAVFDVTVPASPVQRGSVLSVGMTRGVALGANMVALADTLATIDLVPLVTP